MQNPFISGKGGNLMFRKTRLIVILALVTILVSCATPSTPAVSTTLVVTATPEIAQVVSSSYNDEELREQINELKSQLSTLKTEKDLLSSEVSDLRNKLNAPSVIQPDDAKLMSILEFHSNIIADTLGWNVIIDECNIILGIRTSQEGKCLSGFDGYNSESGQTGNFLVLAQIEVVAKYNIAIYQETRFVLVSANVPRELWDNAVGGEFQEKFQEALGWPSFTGENPGEGTWLYALKWWALSNDEADLLKSSGAVIGIK